MSALKIGFLMPYSGIYPYYGHHMMAGLQLGIQPEGAANSPAASKGCDFVPLFTRKGDPATMKSAIEQLLFFDRVDVISGLISYKTMPEMLPVINTHQRPALFFDLGENVPGNEIFSPFTFYASQQIYQSEYALGCWAQQTYRNCGLVALPVYEAGYQMHSSFWEGIQSAGGEALRMHTISRDKSSQTALDLTLLFETIEKDPPAFVHAIFSGNQGLDFLRQWVQSAYYQKIPLLVVENMAYEDLLEDIHEMDLSFYTAASWNREDERPENKRFVQRFEAASGQKANIFALLGYEAGLFLREIQADLFRGDRVKALHYLQSETINGPRGLRNFCPQSVQPVYTIDILQIRSGQKRIKKLIVSQSTNRQLSAQRLKQMDQACLSGWQNPYLCV